eukprot:453559-Rhodomonas_salina.1
MTSSGAAPPATPKMGALGKNWVGDIERDGVNRASRNSVQCTHRQDQARPDPVDPFRLCMGAQKTEFIGLRSNNIQGTVRRGAR